MSRPSILVCLCASSVGLSAITSAANGCGARSTLDSPVDTCKSPDPIPLDDARIFVTPIAFVPRSIAVAELSAAARVVLISPSPNACADFKALTFNANGQAPSDSRWLDITFANAERDAPYDGTYIVPSSPADLKPYAVAGVLRFCAGDPFVGGELGWFFVGEAGVPAEAGVLDIVDYAEGQYVSGTYDLVFPGGAHVLGAFDAGWCK